MMAIAVEIVRWKSGVKRAGTSLEFAEIYS